MSGVNDEDFIPLEPYEGASAESAADRKESAADVDMDQLPRCEQCGYILYKMMGARCPECGAHFSAAVPPMTAAEVQTDLARQARVERIMRYAGVTMLVAGTSLTVAGSLHFWHLAVCLLSPAVAVSAVILGRQLILGDDMHWSLAIIGAGWLAIGIFVVVL